MNEMWNDCKKNWFPIDDATLLPTPGVCCLVMAEGWSEPKVLTYRENPETEIGPRGALTTVMNRRFCADRTGWYCWYPDRMVWTPINTATMNRYPAAPVRERNQGRV